MPDLSPEEQAAQDAEEKRITDEVDAEAKKKADAEKEGGDDPDGDEEKKKTPEDKKDEDPDGDKKKDEDAKDKDVVDDKDDDPVDFSDLKLSDESALAPSDLELLTDFAKDSELSVEAAKGTLDLVDKIVASMGERNQKVLVEAQKAWDKEIKNDTYLGGKHYKETGEISFRVMDRFGNKELDEVFKESGIGRHPAMVRFVNAIGKAMQDDKLVKGANADEPKQKKSFGDRLYPGTANK